MDTAELAFYAIAHKTTGKWMSRRGWTDKIKDAKIFARIGAARQNVTMIVNCWKEHSVPNIIKLTVSGTEVIDETERITKSKNDQARREAAAVLSRKKWEADIAKKELEEAEKKVRDLKKKLEGV